MGFYLETERCILKAPQPGEGLIYKAAIEKTFEALQATIAWAQTLPSQEACEVFIEQAASNWEELRCETPGALTVFIWDRKQPERFLGSSGYRNADWSVPTVEIGYWLAQDAMGQGLMTECVHALTSYALEVFEARRVEICCALNNLRSKKLPERLGFTLEAQLKHKLFDFKAQQPVDQLVYACVPE